MEHVPAERSRRSDKSGPGSGLEAGSSQASVSLSIETLSLRLQRFSSPPTAIPPARVERMAGNLGLGL